MTMITLISGIKLFTKTDFFIAGTNKLFTSFGISNDELKTFTFTTDENDEQGAWKIIESAEWTSKNTASITFQLSLTFKPVITSFSSEKLREKNYYKNYNFKNAYQVIYDTNTPTGCKLEDDKEESY